jgi:phenylacetate-coenzyme A ligase PaaK-like adenylate-forming protein
MQLLSHNIIDEIYQAENAAWEQLALKIFRYQYAENTLYRKYCDLLRISSDDVNTLTQIPFLPISFFKTSTVITGNPDSQLVFESSATTGSVVSRHAVKDISIYEESFLRGFRRFYGEPAQYCIIGLLPSYLERGNSSLVYMVNKLMQLSRHDKSNFYLDNYAALKETLAQNEAEGQKTLLIGVTYALLDFAEQYPMQLKNSIVMETGGMKGRREELTRGQVHDFLEKQFGLPAIHSEYGMTELLSQAYSKAGGIFECSPTMKLLIRSEDDPFDVTDAAGNSAFITGAINIIDLSNMNSCAFIATDDLGKLYPNGHFEVLGRMDNSDIRGCSLMVL